jgi:hypothetical protein
MICVIVAGVVIIIIAINALKLILTNPKLKGWTGERKVRKQLEMLPPANHKILNDVMIKAKKGTSQIDHIVVSPQGIFVIETKNYRGWIHGSENSEYWTQIIYRFKTRFLNPIKQNLGHIYALKETLPKYKDIPYYPIVVFVGKAKLKNIDTETDVIHADRLLETITRGRGGIRLGSNDIKRIITTLEGASIKDAQTKKDHVSRIKWNVKINRMKEWNVKINRMKEWNVKINRMKEKALICPQCGGQLLKRSGRYGEFYGCKNYPQCKYKTNLNEDTQ